MCEYDRRRASGLERIKHLGLEGRRLCASIYRMRASSRIHRAMSPSEVLAETRVDGNTVTVVRYAPFQELETHAHGEEGLTVVLQGTFLEESLRGTLVAPAGSIATRPYGMTHTNRFGAEGAVILAVIPDRDRFIDPMKAWTRSDAPAAYRAGL